MLRKLSDGSILILPISPILSFLLSLNNLRNKLNGCVFVIFYALFGFAHSFSDPRADCYRKMVAFETFASTATITDIWNDFLSGNTFDIFEGMLFIVCSNITTNIKVVFFIVGLIGGLFAYLFLSKIQKYMQLHYGNRCTYIITILYVLLYNPVAIGGIRNFIAMTIFSYYTFLFLIEKKNTALLGILSTSLIHFSFILNICIVIIARLFVTKRYVNILWWTAIVSCISSVFITPDFWGNIIQNMNLGNFNQAMESRASSYASEETAAAFEQSLTVQLQRVGNYFIRGFYVLFLIYLRKNENKFSISSFDNVLYAYMLFFLTFGYLMTSFSVVGNRYLLLGYFISYFFLLKLYIQHSDIYKLNKYIKSLPWVFGVNFAWLVMNAWFVLDHRFFYLPAPFLLL